MLTSEKNRKIIILGKRTCVLIKSTIQQNDTIEGLRQVHSVDRLMTSLHKAFRPQSLYVHYHCYLYGTSWRHNLSIANLSHVSIWDVRYGDRQIITYIVWQRLNIPLHILIPVYDLLIWPIIYFYCYGMVGGIAFANKFTAKSLISFLWFLLRPITINFQFCISSLP